MSFDLYPLDGEVLGRRPRNFSLNGEPEAPGQNLPKLPPRGSSFGLAQEKKLHPPNSTGHPFKSLDLDIQFTTARFGLETE